MMDASTRVVDASDPVVDASNLVVDASNPVLDASNPVVDASNPVVEASNPVSDASYVNFRIDVPGVRIAGSCFPDAPGRFGPTAATRSGFVRCVGP